VAGENPMKQSKTLITQLLLVTSLMLPWAAAEALETFEKAGKIVKVNISTVNLIGQDIDYRISSEVEIRIDNVIQPDMADFKKGHSVYLKGRIINDVHYVDLIVYLSEIPG
jgi:hypothetical protein